MGQLKSGASRRGSLWSSSPGPPLRSGSSHLRARSPSQESSSTEHSSSSSNSPLAAAPDAAGQRWASLAWWLFLAGFALGAPLDGLHSLVGLQVYDGPGAITIGSAVDGLLTSLWVPPLLGAMYVVVGALQVLLDEKFPPKKDSPASVRTGVQVVVHLGVLIGLLRLSSLMYENDFPPLAILGVLLVFCQGSWYCFDRTLPGYLLGLFVAVGAPLSEIVCIKLGFWHYSTPDVFLFEEGLVSWTSCCYFFYTQWVATVARALDNVFTPPPAEAPSDGEQGKQSQLPP